ncbi:uncharacterized protein LOC100558787 isoform X2 [Anolis carolinensis]|uniref:uncharacterized protein LOC100558787 isoform X2 n=1 Tax=Anolis carolinensis TaxID=28377 RepID=UPI002F2B8B62
MAVFSISIKFNHTHSIVLMAIMGQNPKMCRKSRKLAWGTEPSTIDQLKETFDYKFLELLVLCESKSDVSDRLKKTRRTIQSNDQQFLDELKPFLRTPDKYIAKRVRDAFYPNLKEEPPRSKSAPFQAYEQRIPLSMRKTVHPRVKSAPPLPESESWTMVTPVPHELKRQKNLQSMMNKFLSESEIALKERLPPRPKSEPSMQRVSTRKKVSQGSDRFESLSTPRKRLPSQSPCHAAACDAYEQGIALEKGLGKPRVTVSKWTRKLQSKKTAYNDPLPLSVCFC